MQEKYIVSIEIMSGPGDNVTFLKRTHQLLDNGRMDADGHSHSPQGFGSTLQVAAFVQEVAEQEVTGSQWD